MLRRNPGFSIVTMIFLCACPARADDGDQKTSSEQVKILFTGQLMGYFRIPNMQSGAPKEGCNPSDDPSPAAKEFDKLKNTVPGAILLGTGDNFAPRYEARVFEPKPNPVKGLNPKQAKKYRSAGKDQYVYVWYPENAEPDNVDGVDVKDLANHWVYFEDARNLDKFQALLEQGKGKVPTDNVGCFLKHEGYAAVVPGRHDFYFGAERLRELARFLSTNDGSQPVAMLGANLVIETTWKSDHKPLPDTERKWNYAPHWPPEAPKLVIPGDKGKVYPWLPGAILKLADLPLTSVLYKRIYEWIGASQKSKVLFEHFVEKDLSPEGVDPEELISLRKNVDAMRNDKANVYLCPSEKDDPDNLILPGNPGCEDPLKQFVWVEGGAVEYFLEFGHTLVTNGNYGLCTKGTDAAKNKGGKDTYYCQRFSVRQPLFDRLPDEQGPPWPEPYAFVAADPVKERLLDAVVFGVVDPSIAEYTGALNLQWENTIKPRKKSSYKTTVAVQDAAEALKETMLAFDWKHREFKGIRILLAQMSPQKAQVLGERVKRIDVVVTGADPELPTGLRKSQATWTPNEQAFPRDYPAIQAVPKPYLDKVAIGMLNASVPADFQGKWKVESELLLSEKVDGTTSPAKNFWEGVKNTLQMGCAVKAANAAVDNKDNQQKALQAVTMCAVQKKLGADVVLLQARDFYAGSDRFPMDAGDLDDQEDQRSHERLQGLLDRVIWKGDFLTLLYVPGSALTNALGQSDKYAADAASAISLSDQKERELVTLGIKKDPNIGEYLINDVPLDKNRLYSVATSDYISAGDTGYPDLAAAAVKAPQITEDFGNELEVISAVVCREISWHRQPHKTDKCQPALNSDDYLDALAIKPVDPRHGQTWKAQLYEWSLFNSPHNVPGETMKPSLAGDLEKGVQQRGLGALRINVPSPSLLSVDNASVSMTSVNHKFSDGKLATLFPGSPVPQLTTTRGHTFQLDVKPKYSYSWEHVEFFQAQEVRYNVQYTGKANASRVINQKDNMWSTDTGIAGHLIARTLPHWEPVFTFHTETQVWNPLPNFLEGLATSGKPNVAQPFDQGRTYLLLPRVGIRRVNRVSWFEAGLEKGGELNIVRLVPNPSNPAQTLVQRPNISVGGIYWNWHTVIPFSSIVSWQIDEDGDYRFNNRGDDPIDTRFRSDAETALNFKVWPSLSFAPTYEIFLYSNKVQGIWFWQGQASIKMKTRFDFWNHRKWWTDQIRYAPASN